MAKDNEEPVHAIKLCKAGRRRPRKSTTIYYYSYSTTPLNPSEAPSDRAFTDSVSVDSSFWIVGQQCSLACKVIIVLE
jgi:hypothetical protein